MNDEQPSDLPISVSRGIDWLADSLPQAADALNNYCHSFTMMDDVTFAVLWIESGDDFGRAIERLKAAHATLSDAVQRIEREATQRARHIVGEQK